MSSISMDHREPDDYSTFTICSRGDNKVTLKAENHQYLKRFSGYEGKNVITAYQSHEDPYSEFQVQVHRKKACP